MSREESAVKMIIGGKRREAKDGGTIPIVNPATGQAIDTMPDATPSDVADALDNAQEGLRSWSTVHLHERARILSGFVQLTESRRSEIALLVSREMGKPIRDSEAEVGSVAALFLGYAEKAKHLCGETLPRTGERGVENDFAFTIREPLGVMACIVPFNYPVDLFSHKVAPALIMGNAVIVKPGVGQPLGRGASG